MRNKAYWTQKNKDEALRLMAELTKLIGTGKVTVTTVGFWSGSTPDVSTLRIDVKETQNIPILNNPE